MLKWYQTIPGYLLLAIIEFQAFDLMRQGMSVLLFFAVTMLVLIGMMSLSAPRNFRRAGKRMLIISAAGPALVFLFHLIQIVQRGVSFGLTDIPGTVLLLLPCAVLLAMTHVVLREPADAA